MAVLTREQLMNRIKDKIGDSIADDDMALIEDFNDTIDSYESLTSSSSDWKKKYEDNDAAWRKKYRDRFFSKPADEEPPEPEDEEKPRKYTFEELFKEN